jgi:hypothetical protein
MPSIDVWTMIETMPIAAEQITMHINSSPHHRLAHFRNMSSKIPTTNPSNANDRRTLT